MEKDCEAYVDSEEDEIFFGCINEKELQYFQNKNLEETIVKVSNNIDQKQINEHKVVNSTNIKEDVNKSLGFFDESNFKNKYDTAVKMDHNYSIHIEEKIDKNILETPRSIVKADKDGGFLKVLSEIALVKAEIENNEKSIKNNCKDDNKENKVHCIPEIIITAATPKNKEISPCQSLEHHPRRFKVVYNSPILHNIENIPSKKINSLEEKKNVCTEKSESLVKNINNAISQKKSFFLTNNSNNIYTTSINLLNSKKDEFIPLSSRKLIKINSNSVEEKNQENNICNVIKHSDNSFSTSKTNFGIAEKSFQILLNNKETFNTIALNSLNLSTTLHDLEKTKTDFQKNEMTNKNQIVNGSKNNFNNLKSCENNFKSPENSSGKVLNEISNLTKFTRNSTLSKKLNFSEEVKKIVEVLGKSTEDTLNFTLPEVENSNIEDSFFSFEPVSFSKESDDFHKIDVKPKSKLISPLRKNTSNMSKKIFNTVEKMNFSKASVLTGNKIQPIKYFSEKKVQPVSQNKINKCVKKLPISEKKFVPTQLNMKENINLQKTPNADFISKIPVYGGKIAKLSCDSKNQCVATRTPSKFCTEKIYKNQKFKHVASPISAYIYSKPSGKPTSTSINLDANESGTKKVFKSTKIGSLKKNKPFQQLADSFIKDTNITPHDVEKRLESKLFQNNSAQKFIQSNTLKLLTQNANLLRKN